MKREALFTGRELDVMGILWEQGTGTVAEVREKIEDDLAYTTVLTILRTLEEKGYVGHTPEGRAHRYHPLVERPEAQEAHLRRLVRKLFLGSPALLVERLVGWDDLPSAERNEIQRVVNQRNG